MIILNSLNGGRIYRGSSAEIQALVFPGNFSYEEYSSTTVYFYTTDKAMAITKPVSEQTVIDSFVLFHFNKSELDLLEDGVLYYSCDYGTVQKEFNTQWYLTSPLGYVTSEYVTVDELQEALSGITGETDIVWSLPSTEGVLTGETILDMYFSGYTIDFSGYTFDDFKDALQSDSIFYIDTLGYKWKVQTQQVDASEQRATGVMYTEYFFPLINQMCYSKINVTYYSDTFHYSTKMPVCAMTSTQEMMTYVDTAINNAITGISAVTIDEVDGMISNALTPYYDSAATDSAIATATSGLTKKTSFTAHTADTNVHFTMSDVETDISGYLRRNSYAQMGDVNDAVGAAVSQIEYELGSYVKSETCHNIWTGTQAQYNAMSAHTADTLYIIQG